MRLMKTFRLMAVMAALVLGLGGVAVAGDDSATDEKTPPVDAPAPDDADDGEEKTE